MTWIETSFNVTLSAMAPAAAAGVDDDDDASWWLVLGWVTTKEYYPRLRFDRQTWRMKNGVNTCI